MEPLDILCNFIGHVLLESDFELDLKKKTKKKDDDVTIAFAQKLEFSTKNYVILTYLSVEKSSLICKFSYHPETTV